MSFALAKVFGNGWCQIYGGHSDGDHSLRERNELAMKAGQIDHFCDEQMKLALELG